MGVGGVDKGEQSSSAQQSAVFAQLLPHKWIQSNQKDLI